MEKDSLSSQIDELRSRVADDGRFSGPPKPAKNDSDGTSGRIPLIVAVVALLVALGVGFLALRVSSQVAEGDELLSTQLEEMEAALAGIQMQIAANTENTAQQIAALQSDSEVLQESVGVTQSEIRRARSLAEQVRLEQQAEVVALNSQIEQKADSNQVIALDEKSDGKFQEIDQQITEVQEENKATREEVEKTWKELSALGLQVTQQGQLVATNSEGVDELRRRGERDFFEFSAAKKSQMPVASIQLELRNADTKNHRADFRLYYDDRRVEHKKVYTNTPLVFYVGREKTPYELVINEVKKNLMVGYISVPKGVVTGGTSLTRQ
ncbi:MAG TPA: hypothetical protein VMY18_07765 [Acidobacteriota bacterium]|nr:hypothetical protein [Acidobacteriota bacterium]